MFHNAPDSHSGTNHGTDSAEPRTSTRSWTGGACNGPSVRPSPATVSVALRSDDATDVPATISRIGSTPHVGSVPRLIADITNHDSSPAPVGRVRQIDERQDIRVA